MKRVLIVDDMLYEWEAAQQKLGEHFELVWCRDGESAIAALDQGFDVIILDYTMHYHGLWVCQQLVKLGSEVPVLVNTNNSDGEKKMLAALRHAGIPCATTMLTGMFAEPKDDIQYILGIASGE